MLRNQLARTALKALRNASYRSQRRRRCAREDPAQSRSRYAAFPRQAIEGHLPATNPSAKLYDELPMDLGVRIFVH